MVEVTAIGIGETLARAREELGRSIEDVARSTRVRPAYLQALEDERFDVFGGDVYAKGFLSTYARSMNLDPGPLLDAYRHHVEGGAGAVTTSLSSSALSQRFEERSNAWIAWAVVGIAVIIGIVLVANVVGGRTPPAAVEERPPQPVRTEPAATPTTPVTAEPEPTPTYEGVEIVLLFERDSWTRVDLDGDRLDDGTVIQAGQTLTLQADETITIRFGDPGGVRATLNGEDLGVVGERGIPVTVTFTETGMEPAS